jgi:hypothetical protein
VCGFLCFTLLFSSLAMSEEVIEEKDQSKGAELEEVLVMGNPPPVKWDGRSEQVSFHFILTF